MPVQSREELEMLMAELMRQRRLPNNDWEPRDKRIREAFREYNHIWRQAERKGE